MLANYLILLPNNFDRKVWHPSPKHGFQVKSYYKALRSGDEEVTSLEDHMERLSST